MAQSFTTSWSLPAGHAEAAVSHNSLLPFYRHYYSTCQTPDSPGTGAHLTRSLLSSSTLVMSS